MTTVVTLIITTVA